MVIAVTSVAVSPVTGLLRKSLTGRTKVRNCQDTSSSRSLTTPAAECWESDQPDKLPWEWEQPTQRHGHVAQKKKFTTIAKMCAGNKNADQLGGMCKVFDHYDLLSQPGSCSFRMSFTYRVSSSIQEWANYSMGRESQRWERGRRVRQLASGCMVGCQGCSS